MGKHKTRKAIPTTGWSKPGLDPFAPLEATSPRIKVGKHIKVLSSRYDSTDPLEPNAADDERLQHTLAGSSRDERFNPFDYLADLRDDDQSALKSQGFVAAGDASALFAGQPASARPPSGPPPAPAIHVVGDTHSEPGSRSKTALCNTESQEEQPLWLQVLTNDEALTMDDAASSDSALMSPVEESPLWMDFLISDGNCPMDDEEDEDQSLPNSSLEPLAEATSPEQVSAALLPSIAPQDTKSSSTMGAHKSTPTPQAPATMLPTPTSNSVPSEASAELNPIKPMSKGLATKVEQQVPRRAYVAHEQVASGQTALHVHDVPDVSQAVPAAPSLAFTAPTISETATVVAGAPGMPEGQTHLIEGPLPSIDEDDELFMLQEQPHATTPANNHSLPSASRVGKIIGLGWDVGWDMAYTCAGVAVGGYLGFRAGWSKPLSRQG